MSLRQARVARALCLALFCLAGYGALLRAQDRSDRGGVRRPLKIGVVDMSALFDGYVRKESLDAELLVLTAQLADQLDRQRRELELGREALDRSGFAEGTESWVVERNRLQALQRALERQEAESQMRVRERATVGARQLLREIGQAIARYGKMYRYDIILRADNLRDGPAVGELQLAFERSLVPSDVVYHDADHQDVTLLVLTFLNSPENMNQFRVW